MTNSTYALSSIKREPSPVSGTDYMDINSDEAEAGSILLSLSQHSKQTKETASMTTTSTMSIRNLLDDNDDEKQKSTCTPTDEYQYQMNDPHPYSTTTNSSKAMHRYPETTKKIESTTYFDERSHYPHGMHAPSTSTTHPTGATSPHITSPVISAQQRLSESSDWKQQHFSYPQQNFQKYPSTTHNQPPTYSQQSFQTMKKDPKIRRNALHAYISYMTYSDIARIKASRTNPIQSYSTQPIKQPHHTHPHQSSSTPMTLSERPMQHQWPLTAYLKHQPSTHPGPPASWNPHYHSPPPPTQYHHPYPPLSHSALKNAHDKRH